MNSDASPDEGESVQPSGIDLYWVSLGAGGHSVRLNGLVFEASADAPAASRPLRPLPLGARGTRAEGGSPYQECSQAGAGRLCTSVDAHTAGATLKLNIIPLSWCSAMWQ